MTTEQELKSLFDTLDSDRNGRLSIAELLLSPGLSAVISSATNTINPQALIAQYASDKHGGITFEELKRAVTEANNLTY